VGAKKQQKTGLGQGVSAFFKQGDVAAVVPAEDQAQEPVDLGRQKTRTTVMLYNDTLESIELLKAQARKRGVKATMSDILNDAVALLVERSKAPTP
jgi:hypothetical protein